MATSGMPPARWYNDPADPSRLRWWNGTAWTGYVRSRASEMQHRRPPRSLPWRRWGATFALIGVAGLVCFGEAESKTATRPGIWFLAGFGLAAIMTTIGSALTLKDRPWTSVLIFSVLVAGVVAWAVVATAAPSESASCNSTSDCDTSYALGLPFLVVFFAIPTFAMAAIGKLAAIAVTPGRDATQPKGNSTEPPISPCR